MNVSGIFLHFHQLNADSLFYSSSPIFLTNTTMNQYKIYCVCNTNWIPMAVLHKTA